MLLPCSRYPLLSQYRAEVEGPIELTRVRFRLSSRTAAIRHVGRHTACGDVRNPDPRIAKERKMKRLTFAFIIGLLISGPSLAQQSVVGTYRMVSRIQDIQGSGPVESFGKSPRGYLIFTPTRVVVFFTAESRKPGTSVAEKAALYDSLNGWSARYRLEGSKMIMSVDASAVESWTGTDVVWNVKLSGNRLTLSTDPRPSGRDPSKTQATQLVWEKIE